MLYPKIDLRKLYEQADPQVQTAEGSLYAFPIDEETLQSINRLIEDNSGDWKSESPIHILGKDGTIGGIGNINGKPVYLMIRIAKKADKATTEQQLEISDRSYVLFDTNANELSGLLDKASNKDTRVRIQVKTPLGVEQSVEFWKEQDVSNIDTESEVTVDLKAQMENPGTAVGIEGTVAESKVNESWGPGRTKQTAGMGQRVVGVPIDANTFKIKVIRDAKILDSTGKLIPDGWPLLVNWLKGQVKWPQFYPALNDLAKYIFVYNTNKNTDNRQVITFAIQPRPEGLDAKVQAIEKEDLAKFIKDPKSLAATQAAILGAEKKEMPADPKKETSKLEKSIALTDIGKIAQSDPTYKLIKDIYLKLLKDPDVAKQDSFKKAKSEIKAGKLGNNTSILVSALIAGFGLKDEYGDPIDSITPELFNKMQSIIGEVKESKVLTFNSWNKLNEDVDVEGFDNDAFIVALGGSKKLNTGDIKLPDGGIVKGSVAKGDAELKKVQKLIIDKLSPVLSGNSIFSKFVKYGADGDFGPTTETVVAMAKSGYGLSDKNGKVITSELIDALNTKKVSESASVMRFESFAEIDEQFDVNAAIDTSKSYSSKIPSKSKDKVEKKEASKKEENDSSSLISAIEELLLSANQAIDSKYKDEDFFKEYKSATGDDEDKAVSELFGNDYNDKQSWWYNEIRKKYTIPAYSKLIKLEALNKDAYSILMEQLSKFKSLYKILKNKTLGNTSDDSHIWSFKDSEGTKTNFEVDTDF